MNSLEFINLEIAITNTKYKEHLKFAQFELAIKDEKRLQILQQIKAELEAWEVVKTRLKIHNEGVIELQNDFWLSIFTQYTSEGYKDQYYKLKKALEVKENVD